MSFIDAPHYQQGGGSDCQAACAAMVLDYWAGRRDGGDAERLGQLLDNFSCGFRPASGDVPPAITGLVALTIARYGLAVDFYSNEPTGGGKEGLLFLKDGWNFTDDDVEKYAEMATAQLTGDVPSGFTIYQRRITEDEIESAIAAEKPVIVIVDLRVLKSWDKSANHAVVITGVDDKSVIIKDPNDLVPNREYSRELFFAAHFNDRTDCDAYVVSARVE